MSGDSGEKSAAPSHVLRSGMGTVTMLVAALVCLLLLGDAALRAGIGEMLRLAPWVLLVLWVVYVVTYASHVRYDARGVMVQNYLRRTTIPWTQVSELTMRLQLAFQLAGGGVVTAYGGPARRPGPRKRDRSAPHPTRTSPQEVDLLRDAWQRAEPATASGAQTEPVTRSWDVPALIALGLIAVWAVASVFTLGG